jgi:hypothetical protein
MLAETDMTLVGQPVPLQGPHLNFAPLAGYLRNGASTRVTLLFEDLEQVLGHRLPRVALVYREWWANDGRQPQSLAWVQSGWEVDCVYLRARVVTFRARR